ncbi:MAG: DUF3179 domain-containing protein [Chthoniobacterales bacterium]
MPWKTVFLFFALLLSGFGVDKLAAEEVTLSQFLNVLDPDERGAAFRRLEQNWQPGLVAPLLEIASLQGDRDLESRIFQLLEKKTGQHLGSSRNDWYRWLWSTEPAPLAWYADFKAAWYEGIDERFAEYFRGRPRTSIRLDEIRWGGVRRDGIPPLDHPKMLPAAKADYLADSDIVFGVDVRGETRAFPKRILAWHEMVRDKIGGEELNGVYCTLCGTMILYRTTIGGKHYELGTSGFLYRSNKLMYDRETKSLWSTIEGEPVVGSLVGRGLKLEPLAVVTTTWGEWRRRHPETRVLSLATGYDRDYTEGAAYRDYFATDDLMFIVPDSDTRLRNKAEVLALRFGPATEPPVAIAQQFLTKHPIYQGKLGATNYVVLTDETGANRVYDSGGEKFDRSSPTSLTTREGAEWRLTEAALIGPKKERLSRLPAHRAFWFGWHAAHPDTRLVEE